MQKIMPVLVLLSTLPARADALSDLKAALANLTGRQAVSATFDVSRSRHAKGRFLTQDFDGSATFDATMDASGVRLSLSRDLVDRANDEEWLSDVNPSRTAPTSQALEEIVPQAVERTLDFAKPMLRLIARGSIADQRVETLQGHTVRVVVLRLPNRTGGVRSVGSFSISEDIVTIRIDATGMPISSQRVRRGSAGIVFLRIEMVRTESATYTVSGDHLVVARSEDSAAIDGPGSQTGTAKSVWQVRLQP